MKNVLIVDDEQGLQSALCDGLSGFAVHFQVLTAGNGRRALEILTISDVDLVVTDLKMPVMDGFELLDHLQGEYPHIPVIVLTAHGSNDVEERLRSRGVFKYIEKPFNFDELTFSILGALASGKKKPRPAASKWAPNERQTRGVE